MPIVTLTVEQIISGLKFPGAGLGPNQYTFSIANEQSAWGYYDPGEAPFVGYAVPSPALGTLFRIAMGSWDQLIAPDFTEITETANGFGEVRFGLTSLNGGQFAYIGVVASTQGKTGDIWMASPGDIYTPGSRFYNAILHEIGHALGLKHPFDPVLLPAEYDSGLYTVMSYNRVKDDTIYGFYEDPAQPGSLFATYDYIYGTPMVADIAVIQAMYGPDPDTGSGDTIYHFDEGYRRIQSIYDASGLDTFDFSTFIRDCIVDLRPGAYTSAGIFTRDNQITYWTNLLPQWGTFFDEFFYYSSTDAFEWKNNVGIALSTTIENAIGGAGSDTFTDNISNNVIHGMDGNDLFYMTGGGSDRVIGGAGADGVYFGSGLTAEDEVDGGDGVDTLALQGNYANLVLGSGVVGIEVLFPLPGNDTRFGDNAGAFYDYVIATVDANIAAGGRLTVSGGNLRPGEDLTFNGSAETNGTFRIFAGQGNDNLTGGALSDGFFFGADGNLTGADRINGGGGIDSIALRGNYVGAAAVVFQDASFTGIEVVTFLSGHTNEFGGVINLAGFDYDVTFANGTIPAGQRLDVIASNLRANESARVDARLDTDGTVRILSGAGDDTLFGSQGNDTLYGGLGADAIDGSGGNDLYIYRAAAESTAASRDTLTFTSGDRIDLSVIDANGADPGDGFAFISSAAFSNVAGQLRAFDAGGGSWTVEGDVNGDGVADLVIAVTTATALVAGDFVL